jgi:hypothetical protein
MLGLLYFAVYCQDIGVVTGLGDWSAVEDKSLVTTGTGTLQLFFCNTGTLPIPTACCFLLGFYYSTAKMLSEFANFLGYEEDAAYFETLGQHVARLVIVTSLVS